MRKIFRFTLLFIIFVVFNYVGLGLISSSSQKIEVGVHVLEEEKSISIGQRDIGRFEIEGLGGALANLSSGNNLIVLISISGLVFLIILIILILSKIRRKKKMSRKIKKLKKKNKS